MILLTTPEGDTLSADTDVELAGKWLTKQHGDDWDAGLFPFDEHDAIFTAVEELALMADGAIPGYTVTHPSTFDH